jgi:DNA adenine methylase
MINSRPFLKWAGGKSQLIRHIEKSLPDELLKGKIETYSEPYVGSGAVLFWFLKRFHDVRNIVINDLNTDLINAYTVIRDNPDKLVSQLKSLQHRYYELRSESARRDFYMGIRRIYNMRGSDLIVNTAYLIFLNRTCYNGLYRVNSRNEFNVPFGRHDKPRICDKEAINADSLILKNVTIINSDFPDTLSHIRGRAFFYFDPPYRPISKSASFNSYASDTFDDSSQKRLAGFCRKLNELGHFWLLSNSDPKNTDPADNFFDELYADFSIRRVEARRAINSDKKKRGRIKELLISNY